MSDVYRTHYEDGRMAIRTVDPGQGYGVWALDYEAPTLSKAEGLVYETRVRIFFLTPDEERFLIQDLEPESLDEGIEALERLLEEGWDDQTRSLSHPAILFPFRPKDEPTAPEDPFSPS